MKSCEICSCRARHKHHIVSKSKGGTNHQYNLCHLCPNCHDNIHRGEIIIEGKFLTSSGYQLIFHKKNDESITGKEVDCYIIGT